MRRSSPKTAALNFVNELREAMGAEPLDALPAGKVRAYNGCPIYNGLEDVAQGKLESVNRQNSNTVEIDGQEIHYSKRVRNFVEKFDRGEYPELISSIAEIRAKNVTQKLEDIPVQTEEASHVA